MRLSIFIIVMFPLLTFAQSSSGDSQGGEATQDIKPERKLIRAVDDRRKIIRQRRDHIDLDEKAEFQGQVQVEN